MNFAEIGSTFDLVETGELTGILNAVALKVDRGAGESGATPFGKSVGLNLVVAEFADGNAEKAFESGGVDDAVIVEVDRAIESTR
ncbi:MAG: hypothetical protein J7642_05760 [Cyanobacteria bacterium SBC]|nr:hypothetical protein [Cyanobacteria bacterium SBC]